MNMKRLSRTAGLCALLLAAGCIRNDIPYPRIEGAITAIEVDGQTEAATISNSTREVTLQLSDTVDLKKVRLLRLEVSNDAKVTPDPGLYIDLTTPLRLTLTTRQEYLWQITGVQTIERDVQVEGQVGEAVIDTGNKGVLVFVTTSHPLDRIRITKLQLGPSNATVSPDPATVTDFTTPQTFTVRYHDVTETWTMRVMRSATDISTGDANAWAKFAYLSGTYATSLGQPTFEYRKKGDTEWTAMPPDQIAVENASFSAKLTGLTPQTEYEFRSVAGDTRATAKSFTTESAQTIPNLGFDDWIKDGKSWFPDADLDANYFWDSGNKGANTLTEKNPTSPEEADVVKGKAARLESTNVVMLLAAGSIYTGKFVKVDGLGGELAMGRPYASRPTQLKGHFKYTPGKIDKTKSPYESFSGTTDSCHIYMLLSDKDTPYTVNTTKKQFIDFAGDPNIIAFGELKTQRTTDGYEPFTIDLQYRSLTRKPTLVLIVASASKYGDYFTGSTSSKLLIDEFELGFD